jgi:hypothetical protein
MILAMIDERSIDYPQPEREERMSVGACIVLILTIALFLWIGLGIAGALVIRAIFG